MTLSPELLDRWGIVPPPDQLEPEETLFVVKCLAPERYGAPDEVDFLLVPDWALLVWLKCEEARSRERSEPHVYN